MFFLLFALASSTACKSTRIEYPLPDGRVVKASDTRFLMRSAVEFSQTTNGVTLKVDSGGDAALTAGIVQGAIQGAKTFRP